VQQSEAQIRLGLIHTNFNNIFNIEMSRKEDNKPIIQEFQLQTAKFGDKTRKSENRDLGSEDQ